MSVKRTVDEATIDELEAILERKRYEARQTRIQRLRSDGRIIDTVQHKSQTIQLQRLDLQNDVITEEAEIKQEHSYQKILYLIQFRRNFVNHTLLVIEISTVISLIVLGIALFNGLELLAKETTVAQSQFEAQRFALLPTIAPTPQLTLDRVVLPTGHTFQNDQPVFNFWEIPENMRPLIANQIYLSPDTNRGTTINDTPLRVIIPDINIDNTIVQGVDWDALQQGVGMLPNGAVPTNETDNIVLAAHNDIYGELFRDLDQLEVGDELQVQTQSGFFTYMVRDTLIVDPSDVYVMESQNTPMVTLISCYPYNVNNRRIVVQADRID